MRLSAQLRMIRHMRMSASSLVRNCTSGKLFISWPRIVYIKLPCQVDPSSGTYIRKTRYQLIYNRTSERLALLSELYIRRVVHQLIKDQTHQVAFSGMLYHRVEHLAVWRSLFWWCLRGLCKRAVQRMHRKQLSSFYLCLKVDFEFLSCI